MAATSQKMYTNQASFASGEVSPDIWGRTDLKYYSVAAKTMENFYPHPFGGASNRTGTYMITEVKDSSKKVKLLPFQFSVDQAYIIEAGENYSRYIKDGGQIIRTVDNTNAWVTSTVYSVDNAVKNGGLIYRCILAHTSGSTTEPGTGASWSTYWLQSNIVETTTTYAEADLFNLKTAQSADTLYICNSSYKPKTLTRSSHYDWTLSDFDYINGPFRNQNVTNTTITPSATTGTITLTASSSIFTANQIGSLFKISHDVVDQILNVHLTAVTTTDYIKCKGDWSILTHGTWSGTINVQQSTDNGSTWSTIRTYSANSDANINDTGETTEFSLLRINFSDSAGYLDGTCNLGLTAFSFAYDGIVKITSVTSGTVATAEVLTDSATNNNGLAFSIATKDWSEGAWSTKNGYPTCVKFYQNRLAFAGTTKDPLTLWMSDIGDYPNFLVHPVVEDDDAITAPLVSQGVNSIRSMVSVDNMLAFTAGGEWKIGTGSESSGLTSNTIRATQQGYIGSSTLEPLIIGNRVLYCQEIGSTIRDIGYSLTDDVYKGDDMTLLARHMFRNHSIVDWAFQQEPDGIIWAVREDGVLLSFTYNKEQDIWAWARHTTDGEFESVAAIPGDGYTEVYFVVKRVINNTTKRFIEKIMPRMVSTDPRDQFFVDCGLTYDNPISITGITKTNPVVITAPSHGLSNGNYVDISDVVGMTELNGYRYKVANKTTDTFELVNMDDDTNIDGTGYTTYKSGGYVRKAIITVTGLSHLEGKTVTILADGSVDTPKIVTSGTITLTDYASRIHVGLGYECNLETLNIDFPMKDGTLQGRTKRIAGITIRTENSYGGSVGINGDDNLELLEQTLSATWGKPGDLVTGDQKISPYSDWNTDARVYVRQSDPLPMTILSIMAEVETGG
jgi:hypothetical protein